MKEASVCVTPLESTHKTRRLEVGMERKMPSKSERQREERIMVNNRKNRALRRNVILLQFGERGVDLPVVECLTTCVKPWD